MASTFRLNLICLTACLLVGCAQPKVNVNYDKSKDFGALKTYGWDPIKEAGTQNREYNGRTLAEYVAEAVDRELGSKGFTRVDSNANFRVHAYTQIQFKRVDVKESDPGAIAQSRVEAAEDPIPPAPDSTAVSPEQYAEGTIVIDMIDPASGKAFWRGAEVGIIKEKVDPPTRVERLDGAIKKLLAEFPPKK